MSISRRKHRISVVIPALDEADSIGKVLGDIPDGLADEIVVVDNGSRDDTARVAERMGPKVVYEEKRGYGYACLAGIAALESPDVVVFIDADYSDYPDEMTKVVEPILSGRAEMVIGSRVLGKREKGALLPQARFGNALSSLLIGIFFGTRYTDLGPFRAISYRDLMAMNMEDKSFGWTVEMQIKAAKMGLRVEEIPVSYRKRVGTSKITGTFKGTILAGAKILYTIFKHGIFKGI